MKIEKNKVAQIDYTLTNSQCELLDKSDGEALAYLHGHHNLIDGLEAELEGKSAGDKFTVKVPAAKAYGEVEDFLIQQVPSDLFEGVEQLEVGMRFEAQSDQGMQSVEITAIDGDMVTVDANHPLAGQDLTFEVEVIDVRDASADEIDHGHAHGVGGHQHN
ncbi:FKBP-type peptidyl-prolyl cis-trans isomerase [Thiomicrospira microaerophila]|uniref:FKBP-type peptidyl-prolyl cis-trans isomerase n=1 Tax=Thiomicrospira microaerophila TaxID=406020 RepID=UPI0005C80E16|nr:peptidylprolyl isomerase [Thiomicrospira microaerophila]